MNIAGIGIGLLAIVAWIVMAVFGLRVMPSYLATWLFCIALPLGALPLVMLFELFAVQDWPIMAPLRRILSWLPIAALFAIPVMVRIGALYHRPGHDVGWNAPGFLLVRMIIILLIWSGMAWIFSRTPRREARGGLASVGLCLHLVLGSIAGMDWIMSLDPGLGSAAFGPLTIGMQVSTALCAAALMLAVPRHSIPMPSETTPLLMVALAAWGYLHFIQYLIVWYGNLPDEIVWYQHRIGSFGEVTIWSCFAATLLAFALLLPHRVSRTPWALASAAGMLLLVHLVEMFWLVTPGFRGSFIIDVADLPGILGVVCIAASILFAERKVMRHDHT